MTLAACPACGRRSRAEDKWCPGCGAYLAAGVEPTVEHDVLRSGRWQGTVTVDRSAFGQEEGLLISNQGVKAGARIALDSDLLSLGRDPESDIFLDDITVSYRHAQVRREDSLYWIADLGSLNGTYVNRRRIEECELREGDEIQIGKFKLVFTHGTAS